jgi:hypothetical protein
MWLAAPGCLASFLVVIGLFKRLIRKIKTTWINLGSDNRSTMKNNNAYDQTLNVNSRRHTVRLTFLLVFSVIAGLLYSPSSTYAQSTTITLSPSPAAIQGCEEIEVDIVITDVSDLWAADVRLSFDPSVLEVVDKDAGKSGVQIADGDLLNASWYGFSEHADNTTGTIQYAVTQFSPDDPVSGSGVLATITFRAKSVGSTPLDFTYSKLSDRDGAELPADTTGSSVSTSAPGSPDVDITQASSSDVTLNWSAVSGVVEYDIFRGTSPYFTPVDPALDTIPGTSYPDSNVLGDTGTNYYYVVQSVCEHGFSSGSSNRVGEYDYPLTGASSSNYNDIAMSLSVSSITDAASLASYMGSSVNYVLKYQAPLQTFQFYTVGNPGSNFPISTGDFIYLITNQNAPAARALVGDVPVPGSVSFTFSTGSSSMYNFISLPLDQGDLNSASDVAEDIGAGVAAVMKYNISSQSFQFYSPGNPGTDFSLVIGEPFAVVLTSDAPTVWP